MKLITLLSGIIILASCSSIDVARKSPLSFDTLFIAKVKDKKSITLAPNESKSGRMLVGLLSAGVVGAIATANTEDGFSEPKAFEYILTLPETNDTRTVVSLSITDIGSCVEVISPDNSRIELLRVIPENKCSTG